MGLLRPSLFSVLRHFDFGEGISGFFSSIINPGEGKWKAWNGLECKVEHPWPLKLTFPKKVRVSWVHCRWDPWTRSWWECRSPVGSRKPAVNCRWSPSCSNPDLKLNKIEKLKIGRIDKIENWTKSTKWGKN